jgi:hypothetical protein
MKRIDRIRGTTILSQRIQSLPTDSKERQREIESIRRMVLNEYIREGFRINGVKRGFQEIAGYLGINLITMIKLVNRGGKAMMGNMDQAYDSILSLGLFEALADKAFSKDQLTLLLASQGDEYQPFISQTVNQAILNNMTSTKGILDIAKAIKGPSPSTIINNNNQQASFLPNKAISTQEAMKIIEQSKPTGLLNDPAAQQLLLQPYQEGLPEIVATKQQGFKLADEGHIPAKRKKHDTRNDQVIPID